jgi:hypothetical protein
MQYQVRNNWLGREDSNLRMAESKSAALPLGYAPAERVRTLAAVGASGNAWGWPDQVVFVVITGLDPVICRSRERWPDQVRP